jgi:hypothetical protein
MAQAVKMDNVSTVFIRGGTSLMRLCSERSQRTTLSEYLHTSLTSPRSLILRKQNRSKSGNTPRHILATHTPITPQS